MLVAGPVEGRRAAGDNRRKTGRVEPSLLLDPRRDSDDTMFRR